MLTLAHRAMLGAASRPKPPVGLVTLAGAGTSTEFGTSISVDASGNRYVTGNSGSPLSGFIAKLDPDGALLWQRKLSLATTLLVRSAAVDSAGAIYAVGDGRPSGTINSGYIAKYNSSGVLQWQRKLTTTVSTQVNSVALDASGDAYLVARVINTKETVLIAKYSSGGALQWQRVVSHASNSLQGATGLSIDASGNLYFAAEQVITATSDTWGLVVKCGSTGVVSQVIAKRVEAYANPANGTAVDASGNIYVCGGTRSASVLKPYIAKYNSAGALQWLRYFSGDAGLSALSTTTLSSDGVHVYTSGVQYLCKFLAADGTLVWQRSLTGPASATAGAKMAHASGFIYAASTLSSMPSTGADALAAKLPDDGSGLGTYGSVIVYSEPTLTSNVGSPSSATPTITDAAGTHTEAAGDMTDAAGTLTVTPYL